MRLQVLLSAMHLKDENYIDTLNITTDAVVINQCDRENKRVTEHKCIDGSMHKITYIETCERGLSKSRNMAIREADSDICILCDNDVEYEENYEKMIVSKFSEYPDADIIVFYIRRPEKLTPNYPSDRRMGYLSVLKIFSPEIAFRRKSIADIAFDEQFGAGAHYCMGEENIFLYEALRKGLKIIYAPVRIANLRMEESTWYKGIDRDFFITRGAGYAAMSPLFSHVLIWQFALRKKSLYGDKFKMFDTVRIMYEGRREYLRGK